MPKNEKNIYIALETEHPQGLSVETWEEVDD